MLLYEFLILVNLLLHILMHEIRIREIWQTSMKQKIRIGGRNQTTNICWKKVVRTKFCYWPNSPASLTDPHVCLFVCLVRLWRQKGISLLDLTAAYRPRRPLSNRIGPRLILLYLKMPLLAKNILKLVLFCVMHKSKQVLFTFTEMKMHQ